MMQQYEAIMIDKRWFHSQVTNRNEHDKTILILHRLNAVGQPIHDLVSISNALFCIGSHNGDSRMHLFHSCLSEFTVFYIDNCLLNVWELQTF
jgi:hypothetical protein